MAYSTRRPHKHTAPIILAAILFIIIVGVVAVRSLINDNGQSSSPPGSGSPANISESFPTLDTSNFTDSQLALLKLLKEQYVEQNPGSYYAQGANEAWCADFVSWNFMTIKHPFNNPNSGSWRIPGVATLEEYFQAQGVYHKTGEKGFTPRFGDIVIYDTSSPTWHQHTNIVLSYNDGKLTTIGGNQNGSHIQVTTKNIDSSQLVIRGFGRIL
jgi:hypothetical protein